jgi:predicted GNAT family N-acyltransferase
VSQSWRFSLEVACQFAPGLNYRRNKHIIGVRTFTTLVAALRVASRVTQGTRELGALAVVDSTKGLRARLQKATDGATLPPRFVADQRSRIVAQRGKIDEFLDFFFEH